MRVIEHRVPESRALLVMLHGAGDHPEDFVTHGFIDELARRNLPADVLLVDAPSHLYLEKTVIARLHEEVIAPELAARPRPLWLCGISLGGMGACLYARAHPQAVQGVLLMAPFLAVRGTIAQVTRAGGLQAWAPGAADPEDQEHALLVWLKHWQSECGPQLHLAYGLDDRYAPASRLLAARLPRERVLTYAGGHDWATWKSLWPALLELAAPAIAGREAQPGAGLQPAASNPQPLRSR